MTCGNIDCIVMVQTFATTCCLETLTRTSAQVRADHMQKAREYQKKRYHTDADFRENKKKKRQMLRAARREQAQNSVM